jgi:hypothetical protein
MMKICRKQVSPRAAAYKVDDYDQKLQLFYYVSIHIHKNFCLTSDISL